jgi:hypothetical protein
MPKSKLDLRRRIYYCIYVLDRSTSIVQSRAFSFSDDSAKVKVPFHKGPSSAPTTPLPAPNQKLWSQSYNHALDLINLRTLQSTWYTDMFQSGRTEHDRPYSYIWKSCDDMRKWFDTLPATTSPNMRAFFELDLLYSYIYVLSPSPRVPVVCPYAQRLVFEYCILYADIIFKLTSDPSYASPLTFYDAMRVYMTGRQFLDLLQCNTEELLQGHVCPLPAVNKGTPPPPPVPSVDLPPGETVLRFNTERSVNCIARLTECLSRFGNRWGYLRSVNTYFQQPEHALIDATAGSNDTKVRLLECWVSSIKDCGTWTAVANLACGTTRIPLALSIAATAVARRTIHPRARLCHLDTLSTSYKATILGCRCRCFYISRPANRLLDLRMLPLPLRPVLPSTRYPLRSNTKSKLSTQLLRERTTSIQDSLWTCRLSMEVATKRSSHIHSTNSQASTSAKLFLVPMFNHLPHPEETYLLLLKLDSATQLNSFRTGPATQATGADQTRWMTRTQYRPTLILGTSMRSNLLKRSSGRPA